MSFDPVAMRARMAYNRAVMEGSLNLKKYVESGEEKTLTEVSEDVQSMMSILEERQKGVLDTMQKMIRLMAEPFAELKEKFAQLKNDIQLLKTQVSALTEANQSACEQLERMKNRERELIPLVQTLTEIKKRAEPPSHPLKKGVSRIGVEASRSSGGYIEF